jgi:hypothetical protein
MSIVKGGSQKVTATLVSASLALPVAVPYGVGAVGNSEACKQASVTCPDWQFTSREWADLPHTDLPEYPRPASERNLTNQVSSTARTFGWSAGISGPSTAFSIKLP